MIAPRCPWHGETPHHRDGRCATCWTARGALRPGLDTRAAPAAWWALYDAVAYGVPVYTTTCPDHGLAEHLTSTGQCRACRRGQQMRLRPP